MASTAAADEPGPDARRVVYRSKAHCKKVKTPARVLAIGSSTMVGALGPRLRRHFEKDESVDFRLAGKSSTGLARPDFFDWPAKVEELSKTEKPDAWVVMLGTNDFLAIRMPDKSWIQPGRRGWAEEYGKRVRALLERMSGKDRSRPIIYIGPTAYVMKNVPSRRGAELSRAVREQIQAFDGPAIFYDAFALTSTSDDQPLKYFTHPELKGRWLVRGKDDIHLSHKGLTYLVQKPAVKLLLDCLAGKDPP